jgi:hypothetical protein
MKKVNYTNARPRLKLKTLPRLFWRHDIQHNDTQHNDTQNKGLIFDTQHK